MAKTRLRILDGELIEFYLAGNNNQYKLGARASGLFQLTGNSTTSMFLTLDDVNASKNVGIQLFDAGTNVYNIYKNTTNDFVISLAAGTNFIQILNSNNHLVLQGDAAGNVGIGTGNPGTTLDVVGTGQFSSTLYAATIRVTSLQDNGFGASDSYIELGNGNKRIIFSTNGAEIARFDTSGRLGIGVTPSSGWLHILAGTTANASIRFTSSSAALLTSVTADCLEYNADTYFLTNQRTLRQSISQLIYAADGDAGPSGTDVETTLLGGGSAPSWRTLTIPANWFINGKTIRIKACGYYTTDNPTTTFTLKAKVGTFITATPAISPNAGLTRNYWETEITLTCRSAGSTARFASSGASYRLGSALLENGGAGTFASLNAAYSISNGVSDTFDTTGSNAIDLTCTMGGTYTNGVFKCINVTIETFA